MEHWIFYVANIHSHTNAKARVVAGAIVTATLHCHTIKEVKIGQGVPEY